MCLESTNGLNLTMCLQLNAARNDLIVRHSHDRDLDIEIYTCGSIRVVVVVVLRHPDCGDSVHFQPQRWFFWQYRIMFEMLHARWVHASSLLAWYSMMSYYSTSAPRRFHDLHDLKCNDWPACRSAYLFSGLLSSSWQRRLDNCLPASGWAYAFTLQLILEMRFWLRAGQSTFPITVNVPLGRRVRVIFANGDSWSSPPQHRHVKDYSVQHLWIASCVLPKPYMEEFTLYCQQV